MKQELLQALAIELAGILRDNKSLTLEQLFTRCRDGVSWDDVGEAARLLCAMDSAIANGGVFHFKAMPDFTNTPAKREAKPEAELPPSAIEPVFVPPEPQAKSVPAPYMHERPSHHDSVDHETVQQGTAAPTSKRDRLVHVRALYDLVDDWNLSFRQGRAIECILADDLESAIAILQELAEKQK